MWFGVISLMTEMVDAASRAGVFGRAIEQGILSLELFDPRAHTTDRHHTVDDRPYGGGPGMVMMVAPLLAALDEAKAAAGRQGIEAPVVYLSPQGARLDQQMVNEFAKMPGLILLGGRYEGIDERVVDRVDRIVSIGDYVLSGGELPALVMMDAIARHLPGTLGNSASVAEESHLDGLLDYPHYTRPEMAGSQSVPEVLTSGDHAAIKRWRLKQALRSTWLARPDLLTARPLSALERELLAELFAEGLAAVPS
ncbi:MAG: tRNA (guanosine(37)-N1)-methyltransferase TrmD [Gammaproteobacteria bacterium]|jgi:tRNA (guanine37-N1)-methyltransferase|nr:MAG: tRNA (guanosine(37)-N1)-methyltransferase TrmD [Gammaproteobacteria bacterium]